MRLILFHHDYRSDLLCNFLERGEKFMNQLFGGNVQDPLQQGLYFLHIPKTAGTTFKSILHSFFPPDKVCPAHHLQELFRIPQEQLNRYKLFRGHFYYGIEKILGYKPLYGTFLRNPVARYVSNFYHIQRTPGHRDQGRSLEDFINDPYIRRRSANYQTRSLVAELQPSVAAAELDPGGILEVLEKHNPGPAPADPLAIAKERLNSFSFVGIAEEFDSSIRQFADSFRWKKPDSFEVLNTASGAQKKSHVPAHLLAQIRELNELDCYLYDYGCELFSQKIKAAETIRHSVIQKLSNAFAWRKNRQ